MVNCQLDYTKLRKEDELEEMENDVKFLFLCLIHEKGLLVVEKGDTFYPNRHNKKFPYFSVQPYLQSLNKSHHINNNNKITLK